MKNLRTVIAALTCAAPMVSFADTAPGYYEIVGYQTICLVGNHTWYGVSYPNWGGGWNTGRTGTALYGNFFEGAGNDSIVLGTDNKGIWQEWLDDGSDADLMRGIRLSYRGAECPPPTTESAGGRRPMAR